MAKKEVNHGLSDFELAWLVGIIEGEGYCCWNGCTHVVQVRMTDEDIVYKIAGLFERITGKICHIVDYEPPNERWKISYKVAPTGEAARTIMKLIVKHMGWRRRQQIWCALHGCKPPNREVKGLLDNLKIVIKETA